MGLIKYSLKSPFTILAILLSLGLLGAAVIPSLVVDILPDFKKPVIVSFFSYPGLPSVEMEKSVTSRVERILTMAGNIEHQESRTMPGAAVIKMFFQPGTDPSSAMNDVVNFEASDMFHLPPGIEWPFNLRSEPANLPVILAAISGEGLSESQLYTIGYYAVRNEMGGLKGVQIPHPFGGKFRQMMVYVDPEKLQAFHLSPHEVVEAMRKSNLVLAAGSAKLGETDYQIHPVNTLPTVQEIEAIPVAVREGRPIFIRDLGSVLDDAAIQYNIVRVNGKRSVYCPLLREPGQNTVATVDRIYEGIKTKIPLMKEQGSIPKEAEITLVSDQSQYIRTAMNSLYSQVGMGAVLVAITVLIFLRRLMPTILILLLMVFSILIGALGFAFSGQTINVMTLGGLALAIGTVVDAGIVVIENIIRRQSDGLSIQDAAQEGTDEVAGAIFAGTVTTLAVFVPAIFLTGMIRYLFVPLSLSAVWTIGASYVLALTMIPSFARFFIGRTKSTANHSENQDSQRLGVYGKIITAAVKVPLLTSIVIVAAIGSTFLLWPTIGTELFPQVDAGTFELRLKTLPGTKLEKTEALVAEIEETIKDVIGADQIETLISNIGLPVGKGAGFSTVLSSNSGPDTAYLVVNLKQADRTVSTQYYMEQLRDRLRTDYPMEKFLFVSGGIVNMALSEGVPTPISVQISAGSLGACQEAAKKVVQVLRSIPGAVDVQIAQSLEYPQFDVDVDRVKAQYLGVSQEDVAQTILTALGSSIGYAPTIWLDPASGTDFFMGVQYENNELKSLDDLKNIPISLTTSNGPVTIPLSNIATLKRVTIPGEIAHHNIARVNDVHINVQGRDLGSVAADVEASLAKMKLGSGINYRIRGPVETMHSGMSMLFYGLVVAGILVYLVLMAQFRSFIDPLVIMLAVPLGIGGVILVLSLTSTTLNVQSLMGILMMIGVVVNNSILLVEFANRRRQEGMSGPQSAVSAARVRLRPILMTSLTLVASMAPLTVSWAPGDEAMIPLARALVGGMATSTILTLFLVPAVYAMIHPGAIIHPGKSKLA